MALNDIKVGKRTNGLDRPAPAEDNTALLVLTGVEITGTLEFKKLYKFLGTEDAEAIGITSQYDIDNTVLLHHHISEFYRLAPGQPLYLWLLSQTESLANICDITTTDGLLTALQMAEGKVRFAGVGLCPSSGYSPTVNDYIAEDVITAIAKAQELAIAEEEAHRAIDVILEGRAFDGSNPANAYDLRVENAECVSVVIAQDLDVCAIDTLHESYAALGTYLGMVASKIPISDSPAEVGLEFQGNITNKARGRFVNYGYGNQALKSYSETHQGALYDKHYVTIRTFQGISGVYFAQDFTCASDTNDFKFFHDSRVYNKASREIYAAYVPYINITIDLDPDGFLKAEDVTALEGIGNEVFTKMFANKEISNGKTYINPKQNLITQQNKLLVIWKIQPRGYITDVEGELSFSVTIK